MVHLTMVLALPSPSGVTGGMMCPPRLTGRGSIGRGITGAFFFALPILAAPASRLDATESRCGAVCR